MNAFTLQGGELIVRHNSIEKNFDLARSNEYEIHYIAFYADCEHEIRPVTAGHRLALVYNLVSNSRSDQIAPLDHAATVSTMKEALEHWIQDLTSIDRAVYMLQHRYTVAGLKTISQLKGPDRAIASLLEELHQQGVVEGGLAFINYTESGDTVGKTSFIFCSPLEFSSILLFWRKFIFFLLLARILILEFLIFQFHCSFHFPMCRGLFWQKQTICCERQKLFCCTHCRPGRHQRGIPCSRK